VYKILRMLCGNIKFKPGRGTRGQEATGQRDTLACRVWLVFTASKHQAYYSYFGVILLNNSIENIKPGHSATVKKPGNRQQPGTKMFWRIW